MQMKKLYIYSLLIGALFALGVNTVWAKTAGHDAHAIKQVHAEGAHEGAGDHGAPAEHAGAGEYSAHGEQVSSGKYHSSLVLWVILVPLFGAFLVLLVGNRDGLRNIVNVSTTVLTFFLLFMMYNPVINGINVGGTLLKGMSYQFNFMPGFNMSFNVDPAALLVALVTAFLWVLSTIYAISYMTIEEDRVRYDFCVLATLAADLGVLLAGDFMTLFIFFEGLIIFPYFLVAHKGTKECLRGANMYLYLGVVTGLSLLAGIVVLYTTTGSVAIAQVAKGIGLVPSVKYLITFLMIIGFGGKAGLFFEHIWLPNAHPVAPTPASALLSGAMIKAGAYGIFRVVNLMFLPEYHDGLAHLKQWATMANIGYVIIWVGTLTMFLAVCSALITGNSKRMLAFHSVSQMGYIVLGIGCAAYMGKDGAMGLAGAVYHIVNHALFKASLFLCVGAVYFRTHELDMYKLGGLWRNMPVMAIGLLIAVCGISGIPGFNGFASKTLLHHAILEAYEHSAHLLGGVRDSKLKLAEIIFMLTAGGTFASNIKLFMLTFMGERNKKHDNVAQAPTSMRVAIVMVSAAILFIGLFPNWLLDNFIGPALSYFGYNTASHAYHMLYNVHAAAPASTIPILYPITNAASQMGEVTHNLLGAGTAVMLGGMYFILGMKFGWFHIEVPEKFQLGYYYAKVYHKLLWLFTGPVSAFGEAVDKVVSVFMVNIWLPFTEPHSLISWLEERVLSVYFTLKEPWQYPVARFYLAFCKVGEWFDPTIVDRVVNEVADGVGEGGRVTRRMQTGFLQHYAIVIILGLFLLISLTIYYLR